MLLYKTLNPSAMGLFAESYGSRWNMSGKPESIQLQLSKYMYIVGWMSLGNLKEIPANPKATGTDAYTLCKCIP